MIDKNTLWNEAGFAGLILGAIPALYMLTGGISSIFLSFLFWVLKFGACLYLMYFFMKKFALNHSEISKSGIFKYGSLIAILSALVYSAFYLVYIRYINPEVISKSIDMMMETYENILDSNSLREIEKMIPKLPTIVFFTNLIYCSLFGTILSAIYSGRLRSSNPFDEEA